MAMYVGHRPSPIKIVVQKSLPCPVCRPHRSRSLGFFPTYATNTPKYLAWLHTCSSISSAGVTRCLSIDEACCPVSRMLSVLIDGSWFSQHQLPCVS